jgi:hypothetical protein
MGANPEFYTASTPAQSTQKTEQNLLFPSGQVHNLTLYLQVDDHNTMINDLRRELQNQQPTSEDPKAVGTLDSDWASSSLDIGVFLKKTDYGQIINGEYHQHQCVVVRLYDDVTTAERDSNPATCRIEIHERNNDLVQPDGSLFSWPAPWNDSTQLEGTGLKVEVSYINHPKQGIDRVIDLLRQADVSIDPTQIRREMIAGTFRISHPEVYHRVNIGQLPALKKALSDTQQIAGGESNPDGYNEKGHYSIQTIKIKNIAKLGFDQTVSNPSGLSKEMDSVRIKLYRYNSESYNSSHPLYHPKIEIEAEGAFPKPLYHAVIGRLNQLINAHVADYAGVTSDDLIADDYYDAGKQPTTSTHSPTEYRERLIEYADSDLQHHTIDAYLHNNRTDSPKDILFALYQTENPKYTNLTYDKIKNITGLTKETIGEWVSRLADDDLCIKIPGERYRVQLQKGVVDYLSDQIALGRPFGDLKREVKFRKTKRLFDRFRRGMKRGGNGTDAQPVPLRSVCYRNSPDDLEIVTHQKINRQYPHDAFLTVSSPPP